MTEQDKQEIHQHLTNATVKFASAMTPANFADYMPLFLQLIQLVLSFFGKVQTTPTEKKP